MPQNSYSMDELADYVPTDADRAHVATPLADLVAIRAADPVAIMGAPTERRTGPPTAARRPAAPAAPIGTPGADGISPTAAEVDAWLTALGAKVTPADMTPGLRLFATMWARGWSGTFAFMVDMSAAATSRRGLSTGQAKGVLNCYRADMLRRPAPAARATTPAPAPTPAEPTTPAEGAPITATAAHVGLGWMTPAGVVVKIVNGRNGIYGKIREVGEAGWVFAPRILSGGIVPVTAAAADAARITDPDGAEACCFCATALTDDTPGGSMVRGYGPVCAARYGLPHGKG